MAALRLGIVGCGVIARRYAARIAELDELALAAATDLAGDRAAALTAEFGGTAHASLEALLTDEGVDAVLNLTPAAAHAPVTEAALAAGTHVHTEKPLAATYQDARRLVELAAARGVHLSAAPATLLGDAQQTAWKLIRDGAIGRVRVAYAEANWGRIESWHPEPLTLYSVGAVVDVGIYPLTILTAVFGPARRVVAYEAIVEPDRLTRDGTPFRLDAPDLTVAVVELASSVVVRLTASFYVGPGIHRGIEFHGDAGMLWLASWAESNSRLRIEPYAGIDWGGALVDLAQAVEDGRTPRSSGTHAAHVVEVLGAIGESATAGRPVDVRSDFEPPAPLEWASDDAKGAA